MRLIDADALKLNFISKFCGHGTCLNPTAQMEVGFMIDDAPTIEAEPVKHGRWIEAAGGRTICNQCGEYPLCDYFGRQKRTKVCSSCMAVMDLPDQAEEAYRGDQ